MICTPRNYQPVRSRQRLQAGGRYELRPKPNPYEYGIQNKQRQAGPYAKRAFGSVFRIKTPKEHDHRKSSSEAKPFLLRRESGIMFFCPLFELFGFFGLEIGHRESRSRCRDGGNP